MMALFAVAGGIYGLILLLRALRKHGGSASIPSEELTRIFAHVGVFIGLAFASKSVAIFLAIPRVPEGGWFLGGVITKAVLVAALGIYILVISWRHVKRS